MADEIIQYYKELYSDNPKRNVLDHDSLKLKICRIIDILDNLTPNQESKIWPPKSIARDYFGFSQKTIENIISDISLKNEIAKYKALMGIICNEEQNSKIFLHTISKSVLFKKRENIRGGIDIRVINVLPAWLIILEKMSIKVIKRAISEKITMIQYGFLEGGDCNLAKLMVWYNTSQKGVKKHLLIDIKKAFDSINRSKLKKMIIDDFNEEISELLISFLEIYDTIEIDILGTKIHPTKGGPQGSAIIPVLFCYYLNKALQHVNIKENVCLQAYADDLVIQSNNLEDLKETYDIIKEALKTYDLIINPEKCELLTEDINDKIIDEDENIEIIVRNEVKYLGQKINAEGLTEQIIEDKLFGKMKSKLYKIRFLTRLTRIRLFKTYMITKVNHLLPSITLNGHLSESWKCIRRIIFRDILKTQTSPLETAVTLGLGYYNIIIRPMIKAIEREFNFFKENSHLEFLQNAAKKALTHWKILEQKIPESVEKEIEEMINGNKWYTTIELDKIIYNSMANRLILNSGVKSLTIFDSRSLKYPNYLYLLSNAGTHEIIDTNIQKERTKNNKNKELKDNRIKVLIKRMCICNKISKLIINDNAYIVKIEKNKDILEEMTILELKLSKEIKEIKENIDKEIDTIKEDTNVRIKSGIQKGTVTK